MTAPDRPESAPTEPDHLPAVLPPSASHLETAALHAMIPTLIADAGDQAAWRYVDFFTANIRNPNTRKAYYRSACEFFDWCDQARLGLLDIEPVHVAA